VSEQLARLLAICVPSHTDDPFPFLCASFRRLACIIIVAAGGMAAGLVLTKKAGN